MIMVAVAGVLCAYESKLDTNDSFLQALDEIGIDASYQERIAAYLMCKPRLFEKFIGLRFYQCAR